MSTPDDQSLVPQSGSSISPLEHQEVRYRAAPTWARALLWAMVGSVGFGIVYACIARIDEVVTATGELQALGAEVLRCRDGGELRGDLRRGPGGLCP